MFVFMQRLDESIQQYHGGTLTSLREHIQTQQTESALDDG